MPILDDEGHVYAGARSRLVPPISIGDCVNTPDFNGLVLHEQKAGRGVTVRAGVAFAARPPDEIAVMCGLVVPEITTVYPYSGVSPGLRELYGSGFGTERWKVFASRGAQWSDPDEKVGQEVGYWEHNYVTVVGDVHCQGTGIWYFYVENESQQVNAAGKAFSVTSCT